jgi:thioesterase domain-containing protein
VFINIPNIEDFYNNRTITEICDLIFTKNNDHFKLISGYSLFNKNVFLFPSLIGSPIIFKDLIADWDDFNFYGVNYEKLVTDIYHLSITYRDEILQINGDSDVILIGYSYGGAFVYEIARLLEKKEINVKLIILDALPEPSKSYSWKSNFSDQMFLAELEKELSDENIMFELQQWQALENHNVVFENLREELIAKLMVLRNFKTSDKISFNVLLFIAKTPIGNIAELNLKLDQIWSDVTTGNVTALTVEGNHYTIINSENSSNIQHEMKKWLKAW